MSYPIPQVEYRPVLPEVKSFPEPTIREELDLIGVETIDRKWLDPATDRQFLYTGAEKLAGSFSRHIQVLRGGGLDVVFVFDSLVTYRDVGDDFVTKMHQLTYGTKSLQIFLREIEPVGGGDREEAVDEALRVAIDKLNWRKRSKKIILLIGDAPPHQKDMEKTTALIEKFRTRMGGMVAALDTSRQTIRPMASADNVVVEQKEVLEEFKHFAKIGGGESARLVDEEKVIRQMVVLVFGTRWEGCLDEFLKNL
ncbi:MAG: hypothetical protein JRF49_07035 [Deltaproteobacteria bacterium]|nr:hypothetical protein [Deltaproteobacteria bacterium]